MRPRDAGVVRIVVCVNERLSDARPSCAVRGSRAVVKALEAAVAEGALSVVIDTFECFGRCDEGPNVRFSPGGPFLRGVAPEDARVILEQFSAWHSTREDRTGAGRPGP